MCRDGEGRCAGRGADVQGGGGAGTEGSHLSIISALQNESFSHSKNKSGKHTILSKSFINFILRLTK